MGWRQFTAALLLPHFSLCQRQDQKEVVMSKSLITRSLLLAAVLIGVTSGRAYAQDVLDVNVPFDFNVGGHTFQAGKYVVTMNAAGQGVMSLRGDRARAFTFAFTVPASGHDPAGEQPALVFSRHENSYVLSQVWESRTQGREIAKG
jgi:hypothetical protein